MMRYFTQEEEELYKKLEDKNISKEERKEIIKKLQEIDKIESYPFRDESDYLSPDEFL